MTKVNLDTPELNLFEQGVQSIYHDYMDKSFPNQKEGLYVTSGPRYIKFQRGRGVQLFVDRTNGDVLKSATRRAPAKGARGNIFDEAHGLKRITPYGAEYNK